MNPPRHPANRAADAPTRRDFLRQTCCAAVGSTGLLSTLAQLRIISAVAAATPRLFAAAADDYKALVCVFLGGGNDTNNVIVPSDSASYAAYAAARGALAVDRAQLLPIAPGTGSDGRSYGLHPLLPGLRGLFAQGKLAFLANVGTLAQPTTLNQYRSGTALPTQLFAHNEQQLQWQSSVAGQPFTTGWGGRLADLLAAQNENPRISMSISLQNTNSFQIGNTISQLVVDSSGVVLRAHPNDPHYGPEKRLLALPQSNLLQAAFGIASLSSFTQAEVVEATLRNAAPLRTAFPPTDLGRQLAMAARLIAVAPGLGLRRQIFFARSDGWDTHNAQVESHGPLLSALNGALAAFYDATVELGVANQVTTFTASDFGRTYNSNGDGTDHGWGGHQMILGGAVHGGNIFGQMPSLQLGGPDDPGQGRWIPSTSVDEYSATLATWFGVSTTNLPVVLPNIGRFAKPNLGFMG